MGFENRDYARTDNRSYSAPRSRMSIIGWIIAVNVAVFVVQCIWTQPLVEQPEGFEDQIAHVPGQRVPVLNEWFSLDRRAILQGQIWRLGTYDLLHDTTGDVPWHLFGNMYLLFLLTRKIVDVYSEREFLFNLLSPKQ